MYVFKAKTKVVNNGVIVVNEFWKLVKFPIVLDFSGKT
jgi:hypothetical protein